MFRTVGVRSALSAALLAVGSVRPVLGQAAIQGNSGIRGTITDANGRPVAGAVIVRANSRDTSRSDSLGHYAVERLALGRHLFTVRRAGYQTIEFEVSFPYDTTLTANIPLEAATGGMGAGGTEGGSARSAEFLARRAEYARRDRRATFMNREEIAAKAATRVSQLFEGVTEVTVRLEAGNLNTVYGQDGRCAMNVWVNGIKMENVFPQSVTNQGSQGTSGGGMRRSASTPVRYSGLDELMSINQIEAVEVYPRPGMVPAQYQRAPETARSGRQFETRTVDCGAILFWTQ